MLYTGNEMPIPRNVQKEIPSNVTSWSVFDADFDLDIRVENVKKKRKRIEKKIRRKKMEGRGERNKKNISIKIVRTGVETSYVHRRVRLAWIM